MYAKFDISTTNTQDTGMMQVYIYGLKSFEFPLPFIKELEVIIFVLIHCKHLPFILHVYWQDSYFSEISAESWFMIHEYANVINNNEL